MNSFPRSTFFSHSSFSPDLCCLLSLSNSRLSSSSALHTHRDVESFLESKDKLLLVPSAPRSHRSATPKGNHMNATITTTALGSSFLMARNSRKGRRLVREWWTSVDLHGDLPMSSSSPSGHTTKAGGGPATRPLRFFRVGGYQEQSVLSNFVLKRYPKSIQVLSGEGAYQSVKGKQPWTLVNSLSKEIAEKYSLPCDSITRAARAPKNSASLVEMEGNSSRNSASNDCTESLHPKFNATCAECVIDKRGGSCSKCLRLGFTCDCTCGAPGTTNKAFKMKFPTRGSDSISKYSAAQTKKAPL